MSQEILFPFQLNASGGIAVTEDPNVQAEQHVTSLVSTAPGERVMLPAYGVALEALVFGSNDPVIVATIQQDVTQALANWEPAIIVTGVSPAANADPSQGVAMVNVDYQAGATPGAPGSAVQTASILVGGTVIQNG